MTSNFDFLNSEWPSLFDKMKLAEERVHTEPVSTLFYCRKSLEECVFHMFEAEQIELPFNTDLFSLIKHPEIETIFSSDIRNYAHLIRKSGNTGAHHSRKKVSSQQARITLKYTFTFLKWFANYYSLVQPQLPGSFDDEFLKTTDEHKLALQKLKEEHEATQKELLAQIEELKSQREQAIEEAKESATSFRAFKDQIQADRAAIKLQRETRVTKIPSEFTEAETRKHLIDTDLAEAGWTELREGRELEYPVQGMPVTRDNPNGNGFVDYVLWGDDGKPLALIEAKRTSSDEENGRHQAYLYANCLEKMHGQRPIIFYTNGYDTRLWDDQFYSAPRTVFGFYTKSELQWMIQQRRSRSDIRSARVNPKIAGRPYQMLAIQQVAEALVVNSDESFRGNKRSALLVMATGSGKTRTAAALVEVLFKHNWVKRVLFLADRNALVSQAKKRFNEYLPELSSIDLTQEKEGETTRLVFSTYPTMINQIDSAHIENGRQFGVGHFDLIIIDEAHRSVYNRYQAIFDYFDAVQVGLTATPKDNIDHNTYELFGCANEDPTFYFPLEDATPTYLCPYGVREVQTKFLREGVKYNELSDKDKEIYEQSFRDQTDGQMPEEIGANELNKWLFNEDTVNKVLDTLMSEGLKIEGGDKLGRTIIFAVNQKHSRFIVECFQKRYPQYSGDFISMVHNRVSHAQSIIEDFCDEYKENNPQIAVSVDMMDTGVDAPRVLNLVFFKPVKSYAKFWQMIGRGTRLCPDIFGPGQPKKEFLIFDVCQNFSFFDLNTKGKDSIDTKPLSRQIFEARLHLSQLLLDNGNDDQLRLSEKLLDNLHSSITGLTLERFEVKMKRRYVDEFSNRDKWNSLSSDDIHTIENHLSHLPIPTQEHESARRFELLMLRIHQAYLLRLPSLQNHYEKLMSLADQLSKRYSVPQIKKVKPLIEQMKDVRFYEEMTTLKLEEIREEIRGLLQYLESDAQQPVYINIEDSDPVVEVREPLESLGSGRMYKQRVESFLRENKHQLAINKLVNNEPITEKEVHHLEEILFDGDERGTKEDFLKAYGEQPLGTFIRSILGLDVQAAQTAFAELLSEGDLSASQITFISNIIDFLSVNGVIDKNMLFEPPFTEQSDQGLFGLFDDAQATKVINIIDRINENADVG